jgi:hypothetical protein
MKPNSYSTISEAKESLEQNSRRRLLQHVLQFALLAGALIALASLVRFNPPKANPLPPESLRAAASVAPTPAPTAVPSHDVPSVASAPVASVEAASASPALTPTPAPTVEPETLSLFSVDDLRDANKAVAPVVAAPPAVFSTVATPKTVRRAAPETPADEAAPKKMATPIAPSVSLPPPPAPVARPAEAEPTLEVETTGVLLPANTGLVTIKSYVPARVYIDGVYSGSTPRSVKLLAGEHTINLLAEGYHEYSRKVKVSGQQQVGILASMNKK